jgi:hypothetical protein
VTFPSTGDPPFTQREQVGFGGALIQVNPTERLSVAAHATFARADTERTSPSGPLGFTLREETRTVGVRQRYQLADALVLVAEIDRDWRPEERAPAQGDAIDHDDRSTFGQLALLRRPRAGWTGRLAYALLDRDAGVLAPELTARNQRLVTEGGHRFESGFEIIAGLRWDLDAWRRSRFDGGHLRIVGRW